MRKKLNRVSFLYFFSFLFIIFLSFIQASPVPGFQTLRPVQALDSVKINHANSFEKGERIFQNNCSVCHNGGNNIIIPEKNLRKETLEANGMNTESAIEYQVLNGKNGMPAFGGRLKETEIKAVAIYVLQKSSDDFQN